MKVTIQKLENQNFTLYTMPGGSIGVRCSDGRIFFRTCESAVCLDCFGESYTGWETVQKRNRPEDTVMILSKGTKIIIEVE